MKTKIKTSSEVAAMRDAGRMLATVLDTVSGRVAPGMTTKEVAGIAAAELRALGGSPSFLGYQGFPDVICISVNEEVVHGIPTAKRVIAEGDIVSLDFGVTYKGMITDGAISIIAGKPRSPRHEKLLKVTEASMYAGIDTLHDKVRVGDISAAIEGVIKLHKYGIIRDLVGHGVGHQLWEDPNIPNYGRPHTGPWLDAGMTIAIEPMVTLGTDQVYVGDDGWTIRTADDSWAAHFEHTVLILPDGFEILTKQK